MTEGGEILHARGAAAQNGAAFVFDLLLRIRMLRQHVPGPGERARGGRVAGHEEGLELVVDLGGGEGWSAPGGASLEEGGQQGAGRGPRAAGLGGLAEDESVHGGERPLIARAGRRGNVEPAE